MSWGSTEGGLGGGGGRKKGGNTQFECKEREGTSTRKIERTCWG